MNNSNYIAGGIIGLLSGITSGLLGVGGGIVMVPAMMLLLSPPIRDTKQAIGTSLIVIIPTAIVGSFKHFKQGNVNWPVSWSLIPTAIIGGFIGVWLTTKLSSDALKQIFGGFMIVIGGKLLFYDPFFK